MSRISSCIARGKAFLEEFCWSQDVEEGRSRGAVSGMPGCENTSDMA